jgi:ATP-dependent RNA helicase RhlE
MIAGGPRQETTVSFHTLGLLPEYLRAVAEEGYTEPTPVQAEAIPLVLAGRDVLAGAQTGTGKTAAFALPLMQRLHATRPPAGSRRIRALVLAPTRELALQVEESFRTYGVHRPVRSTTIFGGVSFDKQVKALRTWPEIVVATPGRLLDHVGQRTIDLSGISILVLDEADRMLDMGFIHDIRKVLALLPTDRQNLLFSATFSADIRRLAEGILRDPAFVQVTPRNTAPDLVAQIVHPVDRERKRELLSKLVLDRRIDQALVFTRTKRGADRLAEQLERDGIAAAAIHGNKSQPQRIRALDDFKRGRVLILVATDIAARGIDIDALPHVVNYELPMVPEDYVHRIGRTGRAGADGTAVSLVCVDEHRLLRDVESLLGHAIPREIVPGFEPDPRLRPEPIVLRQPMGGRIDPRRGPGAPRQSGHVAHRSVSQAPGRGPGPNPGRGPSHDPGRSPVTAQTSSFAPRPSSPQRPGLGARPVSGRPSGHAHGSAHGSMRGGPGRNSGATLPGERFGGRPNR